MRSLFVPKRLEVKRDPGLWIAPRWTPKHGVKPTLTGWGQVHVGLFFVCLTGMFSAAFSSLPLRWFSIVMIAGFAINADTAYVIYRRFREQWKLCPASFAEWRACFDGIPATQEVHLTLECLQICEEVTNDFAKFRVAKNEAGRADAASAPDREGLGKV